MRHTYYRGAQGVFVVADLTRKNSFEQVKNFWVPDFKEHGGSAAESVPIILLANKNDLPAEIKENRVREIAADVGIDKVLYTSAKTGYHVNEAFISMIKSCTGMDDITPV